jgi:hypothetical protein
VKSGKGAKARMVPFGDMLWARQIVEIWLDGREAGPVFTAMIDGIANARPANHTQANDHAQRSADAQAVSRFH